MANDEEDKGESEEVFKVDTVPPPAGDGDAYNAPTRVGPVTAEGWVELIRQANVEGQKIEEAEKRLPNGPPSSRRPSGADAEVPSSKRPASATSEAAPPADVPRVYTEEVESEESNAATLLHPRAKSVADQSMRADASVFGQGDAQPAPAETVSTVPSPLGNTNASSTKMKRMMIIFALVVVAVVAFLLVRR